MLRICICVIAASDEARLHQTLASVAWSPEIVVVREKPVSLAVPNMRWVKADLSDTPVTLVERGVREANADAILVLYEGEVLEASAAVEMARWAGSNEACGVVAVYPNASWHSGEAHQEWRLFRKSSSAIKVVERVLGGASKTAIRICNSWAEASVQEKRAWAEGQWLFWEALVHRFPKNASWRARFSVVLSHANKKARARDELHRAIKEATPADRLELLHAAAWVYGFDDVSLLSLFKDDEIKHYDASLCWVYANLEVTQGWASKDSVLHSHFERSLALLQQIENSAVRGVFPPIPGVFGVRARVTKALAHYGLGRVDEALLSLNTQSSDMDELLLYAELLAHGGRAAEALRVLQPVLSSAGADGWLVAALACDAVGSVADRLRFWQKAQPHGPAQLRAPHRKHRMNAYQILEKHAIWEGSFSGASAQQNIVDGERFVEAGDLDSAKMLFARVLRQEPTHADAWNNFGFVLHAQGQPSEAIACFERACTLEKKPDFYMNLAQVLAANHETDRAAVACREAMQHGASKEVTQVFLAELGVFTGVQAVHRQLAGRSPENNPLLSVVIPTYGRSRTLTNLLDALALQDVDPRFFEVIVVDDGSPEAVCLAEPRPFALQVLRQDNAGPAKARNTGVYAARGKFILFYNDDTRPARDSVRRHLTAQLESPSPRAVLGRFDFLPELCEHPFTELMQKSGLLFEYQTMKPGEPLSWSKFYTCNLSVPKEALVSVGVFDERFREICEDVECGLRLQKIGIQTYYDPNSHAWHDHQGSGAAGSGGVLQNLDTRGLDSERYWNRQFSLGEAYFWLSQKYNDTSFFDRERPVANDFYWQGARMSMEAASSKVEFLKEEIRRIERKGLPGWPGTPERMAALKQLAELVAPVGAVQVRKGLAAAAAGFQRLSFKNTVPSHEKLMSVIMANLNGVPHLMGTIESFRRTNTGPAEIIVVDNGSNDGSIEWLRQQPDVRLIELGRNFGAPTARNRGLAVASGDTILFTDNDVVFTPRWREILCGHLDSWPDIGIVGPSSDYVIEAQKAAVLPNDEEDLDRFSYDLYKKNEGQSKYLPQLILFNMLCKREVIETIGGIDEDYNPWGFEDNDYCFRARIAGFQLKVAMDCFIKHLGSRTSKTARIDYGQLLYRNWEIFKRKWEIDQNLPYGRIPIEGPLKIPFDKNRHFVPFSTGA